jgi:hypothetical protein
VVGIENASVMRPIYFFVHLWKRLIHSGNTSTRAPLIDCACCLDVVYNTTTLTRHVVQMFEFQSYFDLSSIVESSLFPVFKRCVLPDGYIFF